MKTRFHKAVVVGSPPHRSAFTLIEIMVVIGLLTIVLGMGAPSLYQAYKKEPMRRLVTGLQDASRDARSQAILQGKTVFLVFRPLERTYSVEGGSSKSSLPPGATTSGDFPDSITIDMVDVNLMDFLHEASARVRFFPNGTCDEFMLIVHSDAHEYRQITLESTTGIYNVKNQPR